MSIITDNINPLQWGIGKISSAAATVTVNPLKDLVSYLHPGLGAYFSGKTEIKLDKYTALNHLLGEKTPESLYREVRSIMHCAGVTGGMRIFTALNTTYEGNGSFLGNVLIVPLEQVLRRQFQTDTNATEQKSLSADVLDKTKFEFTDNEVRFQIARSVGDMNVFSTIKIATRIAIFVLAMALYFTPVGWVGSLIIFLGASFLYCAANRISEARADQRAVQILARRLQQNEKSLAPLQAEIKATRAAIHCLRKCALQNLARRKTSKLCRFLVNQQGSLRFYFSSPTLSSRIQKLQAELITLLERQLNLQTNAKETGAQKKCG